MIFVKDCIMGFITNYYQKDHLGEYGVLLFPSILKKIQENVGREAPSKMPEPFRFSGNFWKFLKKTERISTPLSGMICVHGKTWRRGRRKMYKMPEIFLKNTVLAYSLLFRTSKNRKTQKDIYITKISNKKTQLLTVCTTLKDLAIWPQES